MAMNKTAAKNGSSVKKAAKAGSAKKAAPQKAVKKAAPKKAAGPKLSEAQKEMLKKVAGHAGPSGYRAEKSPEKKTLEALLKQKLVKRGKKLEGSYHYLVSNAGQKYLKAQESAGAAAAVAPKSS